MLGTWRALLTASYYYHARNILGKKWLTSTNSDTKEKQTAIKPLLFMLHTLHFLRHKQPFHSIIVSKLVQKRECVLSFSVEIGTLEVDHSLNPASVNV